MATPSTTVESVRVRVPAKFNLALCVGGVREDGYHPLATVFHAVSLYDEVTATPAEPGVVEIAMSGEGAGLVPEDDSNLAARAARLLMSHYGREAGVRLAIRKAIPVAGGMAGGSADGAAALLACSVLWDLDTQPDELHEFAAELGSDVPFALLGGTAIGYGRGEQLVPVLGRSCFHWVTVMSDEGLSTPAIYRLYDEMVPHPPEPEVPHAMLQALSAGDPEALGQTLTNDLQAPALQLMPELVDVLEAGLQQGALGAIVTGSGPTCVFLARDEASAIDLSGRLSGLGLTRVRRMMGPVPGARLLS